MSSVKARRSEGEAIVIVSHARQRLHDARQFLIEDLRLTGRLRSVTTFPTHAFHLKPQSHPLLSRGDAHRDQGVLSRPKTPTRPVLFSK